MDRRTFLVSTAAGITLSQIAQIGLARSEPTALTISSSALLRSRADANLDALLRPHPSPLLARVQAEPERYVGRRGVIMEALESHTCTCEHCDPSLQYRTPRQGDNHFGLRFWSTGETVASDRALMDRWSIITIDGRKVISAFEVIAGDPGVVWMYRSSDIFDGPTFLNVGPRHACVSCYVRGYAEGSIAPDGSRLHRKEWSEISQRDVVVSVSPRPGACCVEMVLPRVEVQLEPTAREQFEQEQRKWAETWSVEQVHAYEQAHGRPYRSSPSQ